MLSNNWSLLSFTGIAVSGLILRLKAKELSSDSDFKASLGWYQRWKKRHSISLRTKTTLAQRLPQDLEEKTIQFHRFVIALRQRYGHSLSRLFNMDETPMRFELPSSRTLEFSGSKTVPVKSCGAEKRSFTGTLAVAADGKKLPPSVIFKGVRTPRDLAVPDTVRVSFDKKGCLPRNPRDERSLLVWDSFRAHLTESVKADLQRRKIDVAVIPGGLTPVLQPLDKCLNKPFKDNMRRKYLNWMMTGPFEYTPAGKKKARRKTWSFVGWSSHGKRFRKRWWEDRSKRAGSQTLSMEQKTTPSTTTKLQLHKQKGSLGATT